MKYISKQSPSHNKVSLVWCQICDVNPAVHYFTKRDEQIQKNIIIDMVSTNRYLLCVTLLYVNQRIHFKHQNILIVMVEGFKNKSQ